MKKDRMRELLTELRDREFSLGEVCQLFVFIDHYLDCLCQWRNSCGTETKSMTRLFLDTAKRDLQEKLSAMGLDYTLDEFITYD